MTTSYSRWYSAVSITVIVATLLVFGLRFYQNPVELLDHYMLSKHYRLPLKMSSIDIIRSGSNYSDTRSSDIRKSDNDLNEKRISDFKLSRYPLMYKNLIMPDKNRNQFERNIDNNDHNLSEGGDNDDIDSDNRNSGVSNNQGKKSSGVESNMEEKEFYDNNEDSLKPKNGVRSESINANHNRHVNTVMTQMSFTQPQGLHVNLDLNIQIFCKNCDCGRLVSTRSATLPSSRGISSASISSSTSSSTSSASSTAFLNTNIFPTKNSQNTEDVGNEKNKVKVAAHTDVDCLNNEDGISSRCANNKTKKTKNKIETDIQEDYFEILDHTTVSESKTENNNCILLNDIAIVFFMPNGAFIDQHALEARHIFTVKAQESYLHTYTASSNPELLAEEAEGEVVIIDFQDVVSECTYCTYDGYNMKNEDNDNINNHNNINNNYNNNNNINNRSNNTNVNNRTIEESRKEIKNVDSENRKNQNISQNKNKNKNKNKSNDTQYDNEISWNVPNILHLQNQLESVEKVDKLKENDYQLLHNLSFSLPIHLRYHVPYDNAFPLKNTDLSSNPDFKTVKIQKPDVYFGNSRYGNKFQIIQNYPVLKRIYDISFLGQEGNAIRFSQKKEKKNYYKLHNKIKRKNTDEKNENKNKNKNDYENKNENEKMNIDDNLKFDDEFGVELKVPIGSFSHNYVLLATVFCYFCTATSIVVSLII